MKPPSQWGPDRRLEVGKIADCLVIDGAAQDPYSQLIGANESDIVAVLIDGRPRAGRAILIDPGTPGVEMIRVANQDMVFDIIESAGHPLAGTTLATAISTLSYSLEHLPDLAEEFFIQHQLMSSATDRFFIHLDMDEDYVMGFMAGSSRIVRGDVDPMKLDPITEIDDSSFRPRLKANTNLPDWLRAAL